MQVKYTQLLGVLLSSLIMVNTVSIPVALAAEESQKAKVEYNPFADDDEKKQEIDESKLPFTQRLKLKMERENKALVQTTSVIPGNLYIPKKVKLKVELIEDASSKTHKKDMPVQFRMVENLIINGVVVIPKGAIGDGYVWNAQKAAGFGRKGVLEIAGKEIKTVNGVVVPLKKGLSGKGHTDGGAVAVAAAVSLIGGFFMKGSNINYKAGTTFEVEVREDIDLKCTPANIKDVMNPNIPHGIEIQVPVAR